MRFILLSEYYQFILDTTTRFRKEGLFKLELSVFRNVVLIFKADYVEVNGHKLSSWSNHSIQNVWASCHLRPRASRLFARQLVQDDTKENMKATHYWPFVTVTDGFPSQRASNAGSISISWRQHEASPSFIIRDHSEFGLIQRETTLHCNVVSHWLSPYTERSLTTTPKWIPISCTCQIYTQSWLAWIYNHVSLLPETSEFSHAPAEARGLWQLVAVVIHWTAFEVNSMKTNNCHNANFIVTDGIGGCYFHNRERRQSWHHDDSRISALSAHPIAHPWGQYLRRLLVLI